MEVNKVLWPTDFSSSAEKALPYVTDLTQKYGAEIHVLYVIEDVAHHESWYGDFDKSHVDKLMEWADKSAKKRLDQVCEKYLNSCPLYIKHIAVGDPAEEILKVIDQEKDEVQFLFSLVGCHPFLVDFNARWSSKSHCPKTNRFQKISSVHRLFFRFLTFCFVSVLYSPTT